MDESNLVFWTERERKEQEEEEGCWTRERQTEKTDRKEQ